MDVKVKESLVKLFDGDEELIEEFEQSSADPTNHQVNSLVHQSVEEEEEVEDETVEETVEEDDEEEVVELEAETEIVLDETFIDELLVDLTDNTGFQQMIQTLINPLQGEINELRQVSQKLQNQLTQVQTAQQTVERTVQEDEVQKRQRWEQDLPSNRVVVSYRARGVAEEITTPVVNQNGNYADVAANTLNKILGG